MMRFLGVLVCATLVVLSPLSALGQNPRQGAPPPPPPGPAAPSNPPNNPQRGAPPPPAPRTPFLPATANVRLTLAITDTFGGRDVKKTVTMLVLERHSGQIRTGVNATVLNVDAAINRPDVAGPTTPRDLIYVSLTFEYRPPSVGEAGPPPNLSESLTVALADGKSMVVSQSADPATDRRVTVEVMAAVVK